ncbi:Zinc-finger homeodomain protein 2 [Glycine max]|nr:Zinc-finger homeodomain protein 2 [Glycine max]
MSFGGHAANDCCEFLAAREDDTLETVICVACNYHRNFHCKEIDDEITSIHHRVQPPPLSMH